MYLYKTNNYEKSLSLYVFSNALIIFISLFLWSKYGLNDYILGTLLYIKPKFIINNVFVLFSILFVKMLLDVKEFLKKREVVIKTMNLNKKYTILLMVFSIFIFLGFILVESSQWAMDYFDGLRIDQIIYSLSQPLTGADPQQFLNFVKDPLLKTLLYTSIIVILFYHLIFYSIDKSSDNEKIMKNKKRILKLTPILALLFVFFSLNMGVNIIGKEDIKIYFFENTSLYEKYYVKPEEVNINFNEKKNLIYIMLESMESSFSSEEFGGYGKENLIPNLSKLAQEEGLNFSNRDNLGGAFQVPGTNQTITGTVAQTAGVPVRIDLNGDSNANYYGMNQNEGYLPGAYALGDVLEKEGYEQMYFIGSDASFAGRDSYFSEHGNYEIRDLFWAKEHGLVPEDYYKWWGIE